MGIFSDEARRMLNEWCGYDSMNYHFKWDVPEKDGGKIYVITYTSSLDGGSMSYYRARNGSHRWTDEIDEADVFTELDAYKKLVDYLTRYGKLAGQPSVREIVEETTTTRRLV